MKQGGIKRTVSTPGEVAAARGVGLGVRHHSNVAEVKASSWRETLERLFANAVPGSGRRGVTTFGYPTTDDGSTSAGSVSEGVATVGASGRAPPVPAYP